MFMLDTSVLIPLRDKDSFVSRQVRLLEGPLLMSVISQVELEGGVYRNPALASARRARLDAMLDAIPVLALSGREARSYGQIVESVGYSRRKLLDRMIAAQALVAGATLVTLNPDDFGDIKGLAVHGLLAAAPG